MLFLREDYIISLLPLEEKRGQTFLEGVDWETEDGWGYLEWGEKEEGVFQLSGPLGARAQVCRKGHGVKGPLYWGVSREWQWRWWWGANTRAGTGIGTTDSGGETSQARGKAPIIESMSYFPRHHTFRVKGVMLDDLDWWWGFPQFHRYNLGWLKGITTEEFYGFVVAIPRGNQMDYTRHIPKLELTMGNYIVTDDFIVVDIPNTNVVLGVLWFYYTKKYTIDQWNIETESAYLRNGRKVFLRVKHQYRLKLTPSNNMEAFLL